MPRVGSERCRKNNVSKKVAARCSEGLILDEGCNLNIQPLQLAGNENGWKLVDEPVKHALCKREGVLEGTIDNVQKTRQALE